MRKGNISFYNDYVSALCINQRNYCYPFLYISVNICPFTSISVHVHFCPYLFISMALLFDFDLFLSVYLSICLFASCMFRFLWCYIISRCIFWQMAEMASKHSIYSHLCGPDRLLQRLVFSHLTDCDISFFQIKWLISFHALYPHQICDIFAYHLLVKGHIF